MYVRKAGDKTTWLASGQVEVPREPIGWLESRFADVQRDRIKSVVVTHPDGSTVTVSREKQADPFVVKDVPAGRELKDPGVGDTIASTLTGLAFQDVAAAGSIEVPAAAPAGGATPPTAEIKPGPSIVVRTLDGLVVTVKSVSKEAKAWWTLKADVDEAVVAANTAGAPADAKPTDAKPDPANPDAAKSADTSGPVSTAAALESMRKQAAELNASWAPYAFAPADWKVRSINSTLPDLLKEPPKPAETPAGGAAPTAPGLPRPPSSLPGSP
jgi:hypothetical protein